MLTSKDLELLYTLISDHHMKMISCSGDAKFPHMMSQIEKAYNAYENTRQQLIEAIIRENTSEPIKKEYETKGKLLAYKLYASTTGFKLTESRQTVDDWASRYNWEIPNGKTG